MQCDMKTLNGSHWCHSGVLIVDFEHISHIGLVFLLLTLNKELPAGNIFLLYATIIYVFCNIGSNIVIHNYKSVFFDHESNPSECLIPLNFFHFSHFKSTPPPAPLPIPSIPCFISKNFSSPQTHSYLGKSPLHKGESIIGWPRL